jgi:poly-gamma-glutamate capsule biosynthesis protein CapA/YwtB (metallophosphatase superfamily)
MIYDSQSGDFNLVLTGDSMVSRKLTPFTEKNYLAIRDICRGADATFTNLESTVRAEDEGIHDMSVGTMMTTQPHLLEDLKWLGVNMVSTANNHATDFGHEGLIATLKHVDNAGLVHSGSGRNMTEARRPGYLDTRAGRVALISANAFFSPWHRASDQGPELKGRPGVNVVGWNTTYTVDAKSFEQLAVMSRELGFDYEQRRRTKSFFSAAEAGGSTNSSIDFLGKKFVPGDKFHISNKLNKADVAGNLKWISEAKRQADWVVYSFHCHAFSERNSEKAESNAQMEELADFAREFGRMVIDAGADVFVVHGPHISLGVEIYKGKPLFYSLGNFIFQNDTVTTFPAESYARFGLAPDATPADFFEARTDNETKGFPAYPEFWHSIMAVCRFKAHKLAAVEVLPLDLGYKLNRAQRGRPIIAEGARADEILTRTQRLSSFYDTKIVNKNGVGHVAL